jgi:hypothetical protein
MDGTVIIHGIADVGQIRIQFKIVSSTKWSRGILEAALKVHQVELMLNLKWCGYGEHNHLHLITSIQRERFYNRTVIIDIFNIK